MVLIDSCVVIDFARTADARLARLFATIPVGVCGVVRAEVLQGARGPHDRVRHISILDNFFQIPIPDTIWDVVGDSGLSLRRSGLTIPFADVILATVAIDAGVELWTRDAHFAHVQRVLPALRLFAEPP